MPSLRRRSITRSLFAAAVLTPVAPTAWAGIRDDAPPRVDAFTGILDRQRLVPGDPQALSNPRRLRIAILLSDNTKRHVAWCEQQTAGRTGADRAFGSFFGGAQGIADSDRMHMLAYDPKFVSDGVMRPLSPRFEELSLVNGMDEFQRGGFDLAVLIDVSFVNTFFDSPIFVGSKYEVGTFINAYFIDKSTQLVGKVETGGIKQVGRETFLQSVAQQRKLTLDSFEAALTTTLGPVAAPPAAAAVPAAPRPSVAERLKALDDLVKQGLLTPGEAAAKRAEILKAL